jgi:DNA repair protein RecN (Recombination protein N)
MVSDVFPPDGAYPQQDSMLEEIAVTNLGLIDSARLEPGAGLVVVTGETGAGKTLLLGALRLLSGEQTRKDQVGPFGDETFVEGRFILGGEEIVLGRRIGGGKSRAYIDGSMAPARALAERAESSIDIVGQQDRMLLAEPQAVRALVDESLESAGREARSRYSEAWEGLMEVRRRLGTLGGDRRALERELEMLRFQTAEITDAGFASGEDARLETEATRLRNVETLGEHLSAAGRASGEEGALGGIDTAARELRVAARTDPSLGDLAAQAGEAATLLSDLNAEISRTADALERDPAALSAVEDRLALLGDLRRKYGDTLDEILDFGEEAAARAAELDGLLRQAGELEAEEQGALVQAKAAGEDLRAARVEAGARLATSAVGHLRDLGFSDPVVVLDVQRADLAASGADRITLAFASDAALPPGPVSRVASGGELSRLVLALRLAAGAEDADVVAFDEIDAGIGGATALAMGRKLAALAVSRQVLCVTHLPQVAAFADRHFVVTRDGNRASVRAVAGEERVEELSRMLAGLPGSDKGRDHAAELLTLAAKR